jgi:hypothetical protein
MNLLTKQRIRISQWLKLVTMEVIVLQMNAFNAENVQPEQGVQKEVTESASGVEEAPPLEVTTDTVQLGVSEGSGEGAPECPELVPPEEVAACNKEYTLGKIGIKGKGGIHTNGDERYASVHYMYWSVEVADTGFVPYVQEVRRDRQYIILYSVSSTRPFIDARLWYKKHRKFLQPDGKLHSGGVVLQIGGVSVCFGSRKQKCASKSRTKAELMALSEYLGLVEMFAEFLEFVTNRKTIKPLIYQDSTSIIAMVTEGGGVARTKHMRTCLHLVLEVVQQDRVVIKYVNTKRMKADGLTKPLKGAEFAEFWKEVFHLPD